MQREPTRGAAVLDYLSVKWVQVHTQPVELVGGRNGIQGPFSLASLRVLFHKMS